MTSWRKYILAVAAVATAAGFGYIKSSHRNIPSDLRDAVADKGFDNSIPVFEKDSGNIPVPKDAAVKGINKGYVESVEPATPIEWVSISGGKFTMGTASIEQGFEDDEPVREVTIKTFEMSKTDVTVAQYAECVIKGGCTEPATGDYCNWGKAGRGNHPVNCVDWNQATQYAKFKGARLPSKAEWKYAATSGGRNQKYPWGNEEPTSELQDTYQYSYAVDDSAVETDSTRVMRGGSFGSDDARYLRAGIRFYKDAPAHRSRGIRFYKGAPAYRPSGIRFRIAR